VAEPLDLLAAGQATRERVVRERAVVDGDGDRGGRPAAGRLGASVLARFLVGRAGGVLAEDLRRVARGQHRRAVDPVARKRSALRTDEREGLRHLRSALDLVELGEVVLEVLAEVRELRVVEL